MMELYRQGEYATSVETTRELHSLFDETPVLALDAEHYDLLLTALSEFRERSTEMVRGGAVDAGTYQAELADRLLQLLDEYALLDTLPALAETLRNRRRR